MASRCLVLLFLLGACHRSLACSAPFSMINSVCVYLSTELKSWCDAHRFCRQMKGELLTGGVLLKAMANNLASSFAANYYWVGLSDMSDEQGNSRSGWKFNNGSLLPNDASLWDSNDPGNYPNQDCVDLAKINKLEDDHCTKMYEFVCQPFTETAHPIRRRHFKQRAPLVSNDVHQYAYLPCQKTHSASIRFRCALLCLQEEYNSCYAFYYNQNSSACITVLYTDARIQGKADGWEYFVIEN